MSTPLSGLNALPELLIAFLFAFYYALKRVVYLLAPASWLNKRVEGDVCLVTGGGSGLGRLFARSFAKLGCIVVIWDINKEANEETARSIEDAGGTVYAYTCDLSQRESIYSTAEKVKSEVGSVSILVNNAGIVAGKHFLDLPDSAILKTFDVNTFGVMWTCKAFLPDMISRSHGHIVNITSMCGLMGCNKLADYCASKHATVGFSESLLLELKENNHSDVKVTTVCPYIINTGMFDGIKSKVFPILEPEDVVKQTISAVLRDEELLLLPSFYMCSGMLLRWMLTWNGGYCVNKALGVTEMMASFKGRQPARNEHSD